MIITSIITHDSIDRIPVKVLDKEGVDLLVETEEEDEVSWVVEMDDKVRG